MTLSKAGKLTLLAGLLCLLLMGFTASSYGQTPPRSIKWDVFPSPSEVITTGRSEVLGSISFYVQFGVGTVVTGNILGGPTQIGITYNNAVQIDSTYGIRVYAPKFASSPIEVVVQNLNIIPSPAECRGFITLNIPAGVTLVDGDLIRVDGVRGRIDVSAGRVPGTNLYAQMQSINDPSANMFFPETVRIATSYPGMIVTRVDTGTALLCFPTYGVYQGYPLNDYDNSPIVQRITVQEGFVRAFVARDSNGSGAPPGPDLTDRLDSGGLILGQAAYSTSTSTTGSWARAVGTRIQVVLNGIPASVQSVDWSNDVSAAVVSSTSFSNLVLVPGSPVFSASAGTASAVFEYYTNNQSYSSDTTLESFDIMPKLVLSPTNQYDTGTVRIGASLTGANDTLGTCDAPNTSLFRVQPRFITEYHSFANSAEVVTTSATSTSFGIYELFSQCTCYLLYPYVTTDIGVDAAGGRNWDTGVSVANTSDDFAVFGTAGAPKQNGTVEFYFYDYNIGFLAGVKPGTPVLYGRSYITTVAQLLANVVAIPGYYIQPTGTPLLTNSQWIANRGFKGYMIVKANFQFCHGYGFVADMRFYDIAQGYVALNIPDPLLKGKRSAVPAANAQNSTPWGESLNN